MSLTDNKVREIPVYWEWKLETGETAEEINDNDIEDSKFMGRTMSMQIAVVGKQVLERPKYTVTFDVNGGGTLAENTRTVDAEFELGTLPTLTRDGYIFDGWFTKSDGGSQIDETTKMQYGDVTYYAHWTEKIDYAKDTLVLTNNVSPYVNYVDRNGNTILCRVLYNDDAHGLQIITQDSVEQVALGSADANYTTGTNFQKAQNSYNNAINNLNNKAENYINPTYVDSEKKNARCVGTIATVTDGVLANKNNEEFLTNSNGYSYLNTYVTQGYKGEDEHYKEDYDQLGTLGILATSSHNIYWLASRNVIQSSTYSRFNIRIVNNTSIGFSDMFRVYTNSINNKAYNPEYGFRPVFLLKSNVTVIGGTGTLSDPYELGI